MRDGDVVKAITTHEPRITPLPDEPQGEAITYSADGTKFLTLSAEATGRDGEPEAARLHAVRPGRRADPVTRRTACHRHRVGSSSWFDKLTFSELTRIVAAVGVVGLVLAIAGIVGIRRARRRRRGGGVRRLRRLRRRAAARSAGSRSVAGGRTSFAGLRDAPLSGRPAAGMATTGRRYGDNGYGAGDGYADAATGPPATAPVGRSTAGTSTGRGSTAAPIRTAASTAPTSTAASSSTGVSRRRPVRRRRSAVRRPAVRRPAPAGGQQYGEQDGRPVRRGAGQRRTVRRPAVSARSTARAIPATATRKTSTRCRTRGAARSGAAGLERYGARSWSDRAAAVCQTRRSTATTLPRMVASSPGIGSNAGLCGISQTWPSRNR